MDIQFNVDSKFWNVDKELDILFKFEKDSKYDDKLMWAIFLYAHPKSKFYLLPDKDKIEIISTDYLESQFNPTNYAITIDKLKKSVLTPIERTFVIWNSKFLEREKFLDETPYSSTTFQMLDRMMADTFQMKKQYDAIMAEFQKEKSDKTFGDIEESLSEKGLI